MPPLIAALPVILEVAGVVGAGVSAGVGIDSLVNSPGSGGESKAQIQQQQQQQAQQQLLAKQQAVAAQSGNAQEATGGSLTDQGTSSFTDLLAGLPGFTGGSGGTNPTAAAVSASSSPQASSATATGTPGIEDLLRSLTAGGSGGGAISGGAPPQPTQDTGRFSLSGSY